MIKNKTLYAVCVFCLVAAILLPGCAPSDPDCKQPETFCVGLVTDLGKIDDGSMDQSAWEGLQQAGHDLGAQVSYIESTDFNDYAKNIATFADAGYDVIVTVGFGQKKVTTTAASRYPAIYFIGVDQPQDPDKARPENLVGLTFPEENAGFLAGALAAQMTQSGKIGIVCGPAWFPPALGYSTGFKAGANYISPGVQTTVTCHNDLAFNASLNDPVWDALTANTMIANGVDVIFGSDGLDNKNGAVSAAAKQKVYAIGVNVDQYLMLGDARKMLLSSVTKLVAPGVFDLIKAAKAGSFPIGEYQGQVGYAPFHELDDLVPPRVRARMKQIQKSLANGSMDPENPNNIPTPTPVVTPKVRQAATPTPGALSTETPDPNQP